MMIRYRRTLKTLAIGFVVILIFCGVAFYRSGLDSAHVVGDGVAREVHSFRNLGLWMYHVRHHRPPDKLADVIPAAADRNQIWFCTWQRVPCHLEFRPDAEPGSAAVYIRCGDPLFVEFWLAGDGMVVREKWGSYLWLRAGMQRHADYPRLTAMLADKVSR